MTNSSIRQVQYASQRMSTYAISKETGLSRSLISKIIEGNADVPRDSRSTVTNMYHRESYDRLRESGLSSVQADRFKWYAPQSVLTVETDMQDNLMKYSMGVLAGKLKNVSGPVTFEEVSDMYEEAYNAVKKGFQSSRRSYEDFGNY